MKKFFATICLAAASILGMQATDVYILGNVGDQGWDPSVGTAMTSTDGNIFTLTADFKASSYFSFTTKLAATSTGWDEIGPYRFAAPWNNYEINSTNFGETIVCNEMGVDTGNAFLITAAGNYTLTVNLEELTLVVAPNGEVEEETITPDGLYVMGTVNGQSWNTNEGTKMETTDNVVYKTTIAIADSAGNFSFTKALSKTASNWAGIAPYRFGALFNDYQLAEELGVAVALGDEGTDYSFQLPQGYYELTVDLTARTLVCTSTDAPAQKYYVIGSAFGNWDPKNPVELVKDGETDNYTCEFEFEGDNYFVFTGAKGSWDAINAFRYGPLDANEEVTEGAEVATQLSTNGDASYKMTCAGKYNVTFNPVALTFKIEAASAPGLTGDVNGDGAVDVSDVNIVLNIMLGNDTLAANPAADVNGDGAVDVSDANAIINIMLGL